MSLELTSDAARAAANWARRAAGAQVLFPSEFMLVSERQDRLLTQALFVSDVFGSVRCINQGDFPVTGLVADIRGGLFESVRESAVILLCGTFSAPGCVIYTHPRNARRWAIEARNMDYIKAHLRLPERAAAWSGSHVLDV